MAKTMTVYIPTTGDSSSRTQSRTITINNLKSVDSISVNTGTVSFVKTGNDIAITCQNGASVRTSPSTDSMYKSVYERIGTNDFPPSIPWSENGYSGTLYKNGLSYVVSGSYTPSDSMPASVNRPCTVYADWEYQATKGWVKVRSYNNAESSIFYTSVQYPDYSGTLPLSSISGSPPMKTGVGQNGQLATTSGAGTATYSGYVTRAGSDTRVWEQNYTGYIYGSTTYTNYYAYVVTLTYTDTVKLGTVNIKTASGVLSLPVYDLTMTDPIVRIKLPNAIGCFELVSVNDARASSIRIQTQKGLKAIAKI